MKPSIRFTRKGWRFQWDARFRDHGGLSGAVCYVGPFTTAAEALTSWGRLVRARA